ncbi:MAG: response regulator [Bdellovibrionota bacterium]|jgi:DNA-binding response OmpR family regulator|nr:response regulator [Bdellovibrionota bacterium]
MSDALNSKALPVEGKKNILIVDDEAVTLKMTKQGLERFGYNVAIFSKPLEALDYFNDNFKNIDLVISDKSMPKMNGEELVKRMRSLHPTVPIIVLSGFVSNDDDNVLIQNGASKILLKPLSIRDIANEVNELLGL